MKILDAGAGGRGNHTVTNEQRIAALELYKAVAESIREVSFASPLGGVPSGEVYATLSGLMGLMTYESMIGSMIDAGLIEQRNNLLIWIADRATITSLALADNQES